MRFVLPLLLAGAAAAILVLTRPPPPEALVEDARIPDPATDPAHRRRALRFLNRIPDNGPDTKSLPGREIPRVERAEVIPSKPPIESAVDAIHQWRPDRHDECLAALRKAADNEDTEFSERLKHRMWLVTALVESKQDEVRYELRRRVAGVLVEAMHFIRTREPPRADVGYERGLYEQQFSTMMLSRMALEGRNAMGVKPPTCPDCRSQICGALQRIQSAMGFPHKLPAPSPSSDDAVLAAFVELQRLIAEARVRSDDAWRAAAKPPKDVQRAAARFLVLAQPRQTPFAKEGIVWVRAWANHYRFRADLDALVDQERKALTAAK